jgi:hypothetical protein
MSHLNRIVAWTGLGLVLLVAAPAAASAASAATSPASIRTADTCPADMAWDVVSQTCVPIG